MGILRCYLALCVIRAHSESVLPWRMHGGPDAVQIFFVISGFYMQFILGAGKYGTIADFYLSRWLRIFFPYAVAVAAVVVVSVCSGLVTGNFLTLAATLQSEGNGLLGRSLALLSNATLFFQDWIMFLRHEAGEPLRFSADFHADPHPLWRYFWIPQAWSVGVELTFYLVAPLLAGTRRGGMVVGLMALSLAARWFCAARLGLDHDPWTYRFFPFELFAFCLGMLACRIMTRHKAAFERLTSGCDRLAAQLGPWFMPLLAILVLVVARSHLIFAAVIRHALGWVVGSGGATQTVLAGAVSLTAWFFLVPVFFSMTRRQSLDRMVGELSYPVYLLHYTVVCLVTAAVAAWGLPGTLRGEIAALVSVAAAVLVQAVFLGPFEKWRQRIVQRHATAESGAGSVR